MRLVRWNPMRDMNTIQREMNRLFDDFFTRDEREESTGSWVPNVDIKESENELVLMFDLPGMSKDDIKVSINNDMLCISGEKKTSKEEKGEKYHRIERIYGSFHRSFNLPGNVNTEKVSANYKDGVLSLALEKKEEAKPKEIKINID